MIANRNTRNFCIPATLSLLIAGTAAFGATQERDPGHATSLDRVLILRVGNSSAGRRVLNCDMEFLRANRGPLILGLLVLGAWLVLRTPATSLASVEELEARLERGQPVVLEFFANT